VVEPGGTEAPHVRKNGLAQVGSDDDNARVIRVASQCRPLSKGEPSIIEINFDQVRTDPADEPRYEGSDAPVRIPANVAVRCLNEAKCRDCGAAAEKQPGLIAWLAPRNDPQSPTHWIILCDDHFQKTSRDKP
jgi:hypothetical protein